MVDKIPSERRSLRNNVEATIKEFACRMPGRKVRVRGNFKISIFAFGVAIGVNFGRIYRYQQKQKEQELLLALNIKHSLVKISLLGCKYKLMSINFVQSLFPQRIFPVLSNYGF